jgi:MFS family permease
MSTALSDPEPAQGATFGTAKESPGDARRKMGHTLWISIVEGSFTTVFFSWTTGSVLTGYMLHLGAGPSALAAVASVPMLAQVVNPLMAWAAVRFGRRKRFIGCTTSLGRGIWLLAALLPLLSIPVAWLPWAMVALVAVSSILQTGAGPAWVSLMADVIPEEIRGRYFGLRNGLVGIMGTAATLAGGWYLDRTAAPAGFQMIFIVAVLFAVVGIYLYGLQYEPRMAGRPVPLLRSMTRPLRDRNFVRFVAFSCYWNFGVMIAAPFVIPYFLQDLRMSYSGVAIWGAIASVVALFTSPLWGRVADHAGNKAVLTVTMVIGGVVIPFCWIAATPDALLYVWLSGAMAAVSWGGIGTAMFNMGIASAKPAERIEYVAVAGLFTGLAGFLGGWVSGRLLGLLLPHEFMIAGFRWTGYHSLFLISGILRTSSPLLLRSVHERKAWRTRDLLRAFWLRSLEAIPWRQSP